MYCIIDFTPKLSLRAKTLLPFEEVILIIGNSLYPH